MSRNIPVKGHYRTYYGKRVWVNRHSRTIDSTKAKKLSKYQDRTLFKKAKYPKYAKIVSFKNPTEARESKKKLLNEYKNAQTEEKKLRIARVAHYSRNRAKVISKKKNLSSKERKEFKEITIIYGNLADQLFERYRQRYLTNVSISRNAFFSKRWYE